MAMTRQQRKIFVEIFPALVLLGAGSDLLGAIGLWGDSLPESIVLADLQVWDEATLKELRDRISQMQTSSPLPSGIPSEGQQTSHSAL